MLSLCSVGATFPINPLELYVQGFPPSTTKDEMKILFKTATDITFPHDKKTKDKK